MNARRKGWCAPGATGLLLWEPDLQQAEPEAHVVFVLVPPPQLDHQRVGLQPVPHHTGRPEQLVSGVRVRQQQLQPARAETNHPHADQDRHRSCAALVALAAVPAPLPARL